MWLMILKNGSVPEGRTELSFHLFSEFLMASACIVGGILLLRRNSLGKPVCSIGLGMVLYSVLNAGGYYGELGNTPMMIMFIFLFVLSMVALLINLQVGS
jgi:lipopolysaccharide export LptBFGC system permease protein LptF